MRKRAKSLCSDLGCNARVPCKDAKGVPLPDGVIVDVIIKHQREKNINVFISSSPKGDTQDFLRRAQFKISLMAQDKQQEITVSLLDRAQHIVPPHVTISNGKKEAEFDWQLPDAPTGINVIVTSPRAKLHDGVKLQLLIEFRKVLRADISKGARVKWESTTVDGTPLLTDAQKKHTYSFAFPCNPQAV